MSKRLIPNRPAPSSVPRWACALVLIGGCIGRQGPDLPENIGMSHRTDPAAQARPEEDVPEPEPEPVPVGTRVWANYRNTGFFFFGVVTERREAQHHVIYADGSAGWVGAESLLPDSLALDATVDVRRGFEADFAEADIGRRLGDSVYVRFANGDERWSVLPHVRFQSGDTGAPRRGDDPAPDAPGGVDPGANVLVNYHQGGFRFGAIMTAVGEDGRYHVVYLDGETEWVAPQLVTPDTLGEGDLVHVRRRWEPAEWVRGRVRTRHAHALQVELDDGGLAWTTLFRVRAPIGESGHARERAVEPDGPEAD